MTSYSFIWILFVLFLLTNTAYLSSVPGLMGDEASEGENVYELLQEERVTVQGERSYIGPFIDYLRVPFIGLFGYTTLALRIPMLLFSVATFWLAWFVLRRLFGEELAVYALVGLVFSPIYILQQRLGWAITLFPFFAFLILALLLSKHRHKWLLAGLAAGVGLANHILFLPTLVGILVGGIVYIAPTVLRQLQRVSIKKLLITNYHLPITAAIGFWAGFGMQFVVLALHREDQGDPAAVAELFTQRLAALWQALPLYLSGSSYVARYTGQEFSGMAMTIITTILGMGVLLTLFFERKRLALWAWVVGLFAHTGALMYMVDRLALRYLVVLSLGVWILAGLGVGAVLLRMVRKHQALQQAVAILFAVGLVIWMSVAVLFPFLRTGGSTERFSLGNRTDSAAALVDVRALIECLRGKGPVYSENVHIWNRLQYISHEVLDLEVVAEEEASRARWVVHYKERDKTVQGELCPYLANFLVLAIDK